ncbi:MAG: hypothetical protein AVDCRST_MAG49-1652 [uncultured Thermomicrobiales bacterium]|uniref:Rhodanese domain-containing protein n=1 Tax=uncultured Thermomicrobiales bacterium TaxID=1645740 RepID=A0A6J4UG90_9BACT|nr:MAG: hypothetical protein AVDCRST_MAG49-1652 [uncultured Thermomicrobiales bacterium]
MAAPPDDGSIGDHFGDDGPIVSVAWLRARLGQPGVRVVDVRPANAYAAAHIPGAAPTTLAAIRLDRSAPDAIARFAAALSDEVRRLGVRPGEKVVFVEDVSGTMAARAVWALDYLGHGGGALLDGGLVAWAAAGGALTRDPTPPEPPGDLSVVPDPTVLVTADELLAGIAGSAGGHGAGASGSPPLPVDSRGDAEYALGTIPGAVHVDWTRHLRPDGRLRPPSELRALYAEAGLPDDPDRPLATFCGSGYRAAHAYVVLRALGHRRVGNYVPSWNEWGARADLPVTPGR